MAKRTGLGRGIGALIPTSESAEARPVDVFFPGASTPAARAAARAADASPEADLDESQTASPAPVVVMRRVLRRVDYALADRRTASFLPAPA